MHQHGRRSSATTANSDHHLAKRGGNAEETGRERFTGVSPSYLPRTGMELAQKRPLSLSLLTMGGQSETGESASRRWTADREPP